MAEIRFDGRVAVITGAGGGLGRTYALEIARRGGMVVVNDLGGKGDGTGAGHSMADQTVKEINEMGARAEAIGANRGLRERKVSSRMPATRGFGLAHTPRSGEASG